MNIEQIKKDRANGVSICNATWNKLIEAALLMQSAIQYATRDELGQLTANNILTKIKEM